MFTDSTEKQAVEQYETQYDNTNKPRGANDLAALLMTTTAQDIATNHTVAAMCTCNAEGKIPPIYFIVLTSCPNSVQ